jgi:glutamate 5-kinase
MKRIVLKIGTSSITNEDGLSEDKINNIVDLLIDLQDKYEVIFVSSGAVYAGYGKVKLDKSDIINKQVLSAVGQPKLMSIYEHKFDKKNIVLAQVLLTASMFDSRIQTHNALQSINCMIDNHILPIINENDTIDTSELRFGDNDQLSAYVCHHFKASMLIILSDIDGYYDKNPNTHNNAKLIKEVNIIDEKEFEKQPSPNSKFATGGILTKLLSAKFLMENNNSMFLSNGINLQNIRDFLLNDNHIGGTLFKKIGK